MALKFRSLFSRTERSYTEKMEQGSRNSKDEDDDFEDAASELTPLSAMADSFEELSVLVKSKGFDHDLDLKTFCDAFSHVSVLFGCLGMAFKFAELEYVSKYIYVSERYEPKTVPFFHKFKYKFSIRLSNYYVFMIQALDLIHKTSNMVGFLGVSSHAPFEDIEVSDLKEAAASYGTLNNILHIDLLNDTVRTSGSLTRNLRRVRQGLDLIRALFQNFLSPDYYCLKDAASEAYMKTCAMYHTWAVRTAVYAGMYALPTREQLLIKLNETDESALREMQRYIDASLPIIEYIDNLYISRNISLDW